MANSTQKSVQSKIQSLISALDSDQYHMRVHNLHQPFTKTAIISTNHMIAFFRHTLMFTNLKYLVYIKTYYGILRAKHDSLKALAGKHNCIIEVQEP